MRIEVLEESLKDTDQSTGTRYSLSKSDVVTVSDECGKRWCGFGWVKDLEGKVKTGERKPGAEVLQPQKKVVKSGAKRGR